MENQENGHEAEEELCSSCQAIENLFDEDWDNKNLSFPEMAMKRVMAKLNKINEKLEVLLENDD